MFFLAFCVLSLGATLGQNFQILELEEHEVCRSFWGDEWTCQKMSDCPEMGGSRRPVVCSYQGWTPVICCPPKPRKLPTRHVSQTGKAKQACDRYAELCGSGPRRGFGGGHYFNEPGPYWRPYRFKRQISLEEQRPSIVGGSNSRPRSRPYMALVGYGDAETKEWNCGGSLISDRYILTAGHCAYTKNQGPARWVRLGELDFSRQDDDAMPEEFEVAERIVHPDYKEPAIYNDVALLRLDKKVKFSPWMRPVCLQTTHDIPALRATATGWGRTDFVGDVSPALQEVALSIIDESECKHQIGRSMGLRLPNGVDGSRMVCAGERKGGKDTCSGDSGGPLVIKEVSRCLYTQIGITSFGKQCALPNSPGVYTRVSHFIPWIESVVWR